MADALVASGKREVLAWKRCPSQIGLSWNLASREISDLIHDQLIAALVGLVCRRFHGVNVVNVVGEDASPILTKSGTSHPAASKKFVKVGHVHPARRRPLIFRGDSTEFFVKLVQLRIPETRWRARPLARQGGVHECMAGPIPSNRTNLRTEHSHVLT